MERTTSSTFCWKSTNEDSFMTDVYGFIIRSASDTIFAKHFLPKQSADHAENSHGPQFEKQCNKHVFLFQRKLFLSIFLPVSRKIKHFRKYVFPIGKQITTQKAVLGVFYLRKQQSHTEWPWRVEWARKHTPFSAIKKPFNSQLHDEKQYITQNYRFFPLRPRQIRTSTSN
jgi:hypothetical protein